jgi:membrane protease YdiL (CAAX protease family)
MASSIQRSGQALVAVAAFFLVWGLFLRFGGFGLGGQARFLAMAAIWLGFAWVWARLAARGSPFSALGLVRRAGSGLGVGALAGMGVLAVQAVHLWWSRGRLPHWPGDPLAVAILPVLEEVLFRGALLSLLMTRLGFWPANLLAAALYALAQALPLWLAGRLHPGDPAWGLGLLAAAGLALGWLRRKGGLSLWASILPHWAYRIGFQL